MAFRGFGFSLLCLFWLLSVAVQAQTYPVDGVGKYLRVLLDDAFLANGEQVPNQAVLLEDDVFYVAESFVIDQSDLPDLYVLYYYNPDDSIVKKIALEWDANRHAESANNPQSDKMIDAMVNHYAAVNKTISAQLGNGHESGHDLNDSQLLNEQSGLKRRTIWKKDGRECANLQIWLRNYYHASGKVTFPTVHRIRLYLK